ncbi:MAG: hypothetical protein WA918_03495, partial [Erythrobacter sp.]
MTMPATTAFAQANDIFVEQAGDGDISRAASVTAPAQPLDDERPSVYLDGEDPLAPASDGGADGGALDQISSSGDPLRTFGQLSAAERQVLLEAVEGTDICERDSDIPAIRA